MPSPKAPPRATRAWLAASVVLLVLGAETAFAIVGGRPADDGEYPWMVALFSKRPEEQFCGGALLAPRVVVTAAHCVVDSPKRTIPDAMDRVADSTGADLRDAMLPVRDAEGLAIPGAVPYGRAWDLVFGPRTLGALLGRTLLSGEGGEEIWAKRVYLHPDYRTRGVPDIAIVTLERPSAQQPLAFARPGDEALYAPGTIAVVTGWGAIGTNEPASDLLLEVEVPVVSDAKCNSAYAPLGGIEPAFEVCAGSKGKDSCYGDSGGPLTVPGRDGQPLLIGIVSWGGDRCGDAVQPGVYAEVVSAAEFLEPFA